MTLISYFRTAITVLCLFSTAGCLHCGDAIFCPPTPTEEFPYDAVPVPRMSGDSLQFDAPKSLRRYRNHAIEKVHVYELYGGRIVWQIESNMKAKITEKPLYDPNAPLVYGQPIEGTTVAVQPMVLQVGVEYIMRGDFTGYDQISVQASEHVKVTFKLRQENGQIRVEQLPTKRAM